MAAARCVALALLSISAAASTPPTPPLNVADAQYLTDYPNAKCLDGTPAYYYIRKATAAANTSKWVIHIQGGGWCASMDSCYSRAQTNLGSSAHNKTHETDVQDLNAVHGCMNNRWCGALMVNDPAINPNAHDWNAVLLRYCDGASWTGNMLKPVFHPDHPSDPMYFSGRYNLEAVFKDLIKKHGLGAASDVLIGGDSAGGLATFLHIDAMKDWITAESPKAVVLGMPDSGFWPDDTRNRFSGTFRQMFAMQNGSSTAGLPKNCKWRSTNVTRCLFPQYFADEIETRLFPLQSIYDPLQKGVDPESHGKWLIGQINSTILSKPGNGAWLHSCERHCGAELLTIDGTQYPDATQAFMGGSQQKLWLQDRPYPCKSCCNDSQRAAARGQSGTGAQSAPMPLWQLELQSLPTSSRRQSVRSAPVAAADDNNCSAQCGGAPLNLSTAVPNVMLLSDSIGAESSGYFTNVRALLGPGIGNSSITGGGVVGNAFVQHTGSYGKGICGTSFGVVACADDWFGNMKFDVIHFNWGLHDICAKMYAPVAPEQYAANMELLYAKMKTFLKPKGTLIWSSTTPVPPSYHNRVNSDVLRINAQMKQLFGPDGRHKDVVFSDMYGAVVARCNRDAASVGYPATSDCDVMQSRGVHFSDAGKQYTAIVAAAAIAPYL